ncbi:MAG: hypothetical protein ACLFVC_05615, partial [Opitutales bacterium]
QSSEARRAKEDEPRITHHASRISPSAPLAICFTRPVANDVLRPDGRKIAGAALKRSRHGLLLQGSLDRAALPESFDYERFKSDFARQLAAHFHLPAEQPEDLRGLFDGAAIQNERLRFDSDDWNRRR